MSAPPGYNASASMLPDTGGAIRAMQGGFLASPYTGGLGGETISLLKAVPPGAAPIASYSGGANNEIPVAVASTAIATSATTSAAPQSSQEEAIAVATNVASSEALPVASSAASSIASPIAPIATAVVAAKDAAPSFVEPKVSSKEAVRVLNSNPSATAAIATVAALAQENANNDILSTNGIAGSNVGNNSEEDVENNSNAITAAVGVIASNSKNQSDEKVETKTINVYGKEYNVPNPIDKKQNDEWDKLMSNIGFDVLSELDQKEFKQMVYEDSTCIEKDLPISTAIQCKPIRKFIFKLLEELLKRPPALSTGTTIKVNSDKNMQELSIKKIGVLSESTSEEKPKEEKKGGLRERKRRTIRKNKE